MITLFAIAIWIAPGGLKKIPNPLKPKPKEPDLVGVMFAEYGTGNGRTRSSLIALLDDGVALEISEEIGGSRAGQRRTNGESEPMDQLKEFQETESGASTSAAPKINTHCHRSSKSKKKSKDKKK